MALVLSLALPLTSMLSSLPAAYASTNLTVKGSGTFRDTSVTILSIQTIGSSTVIKDWGVGQVTGTLTGTYYFSATITVQPTGAATYSAIDGCQCTIAGKAGGLVFDELGVGNSITGAFQSKATITQTSDNLKGITGSATLTGTQNPVTMLTAGTYTISLNVPQNKQTTVVYYPTPGSTYGAILPTDTKSATLSPAHTDVSPKGSVGTGVSHSVANPAAPVSGHSETNHATATQPPSKPASPAPNTHPEPSHPHRSP